MIVHLKSTPSTMLDAAKLASEGASHMTVVVADEQTAGQGRHGHSWMSPEGSLYCTFILRPEKTLPMITLALGLAVAEATQIRVDLRWPNDVMIGTKKLAGILTTFQNDVVLAGIGVNLKDPAHPDAAWLEGVSRDELLDRLIPAVEQSVKLSQPDILRLFTQASSYVFGRRVHVEGHGLGVTDGLDENGFLLLRKDDGSRVTILAGGVRPA